MVSIGRICQTGLLAAPLRADIFQDSLYQLVRGFLIQQRRVGDAALKNMAILRADPKTAKVIERARREGPFSKPQY